MKKWKLDISFCRWPSPRGIEEIEVIRETPKQIVYLTLTGREERMYKQTNTVFICDSRKEAILKGEEYFKKEISKAFEQLQYERKVLKRFKENFSK